VQVAFLEANPAVNLVGSTGMVFGNKGEPIGLLPVYELMRRSAADLGQVFILATQPGWDR
jgi:hypothetical protein